MPKKNGQKLSEPAEILKIYYRIKRLIRDLPSKEIVRIQDYLNSLEALITKLDNSLLIELDECILQTEKMISREMNSNCEKEIHPDLSRKLADILEDLLILRDHIYKPG